MQHVWPRFGRSVRGICTAAFLTICGLGVAWGQESAELTTNEWENVFVPVPRSGQELDQVAKIKRGEPSSVERLGPKVAIEWGYEFFADPKMAADRRVMYAYDLREMQAADIDAILTKAREANGDLLVAYIANFEDPINFSKISDEGDLTFVAVPIKLNRNFGDALRAIKDLYSTDSAKAKSEMVQFATELFKAAGLHNIDDQIAEGNATIYLAVGKPFNVWAKPAFKSVAAFRKWPTSD